MWDEKSLVTAKKRQCPQVQMRAVFVALISKFQSVVTAERPNTFRPEIYLRPSLREDQAGVIHAISPIWMKLFQIEGITKQL